jgi:F0F1-type ATP synthase delta subunit
VLLEITVDPSLIAGASISFNGKDVNYSVMPKVEHIASEIIATAANTAAK